MALFRIGIVLVGAIMLLPVEDTKQTGVSATTAHTADRTLERTPTFCERNPSTCANARDAWALFLRKAEHAMELSARLLREQLARSLSSDEPSAPTAQQAAAPTFAPAPRAASSARLDEPPPRRTYLMDNPSRWR